MVDLIFDTCCGFIKLKTGCFIIGYLELITCIIALVLTGIALAGGVALSGEDEMELKEAGFVVIVVSVVLLLCLIVFFAFTIALLVGLHKNKPGHVKAFLVYGTIFTVLSGIYIIANFANRTATPANVTEQLISFVLNIYFLLVIRSQYYVMKNPPANGPVAYTS